ncbi:MAG: hypothetical protein M1372_00400 [Patescibacteria group bacterium]|nr:hypothetical protein [Patescibacteria group bacterium]
MKSEHFIEGLVSESIKLVAETPPLFPDRTQAGKQLAEILAQDTYTDPVIVAIPKGGVPVALPIQDRLKAPLYLFFAAKIPFSSDRRFGIGAMTTVGPYLNDELIDLFGSDDERIKSGLEYASEVIKRNMAELDQISPLPDLEGKTAILVDDGISTGYTALAAATSLKSLHAQRIIVASPVANTSSLSRLLSKGFEHVVVHQSDSPGFIVDNFYRAFPDLSPLEVRDMLVA